MKHPSDEELLSQLIGVSGDPDQGPAAAHLRAGCERCRRRAEEFHTVLSALRADAKEEDVPARWVARALAWVRDQQAAPPAEPQGLGRRVAAAAEAVRRACEEIRAAIVLDTAAGALLPGVRGAAPASERQILCESPAGQIALRVSAATPGPLEVQGQFLSERPDFDPSRDRALLLAGEGDTVQPMSANGEFRFAAVRPGTVRIRIEGAAYRVTTDSLELSAEI